VNDSFLVCVLYRLANRNKQFQPFASTEPVTVTIRRNGSTRNVFHDEVRRTVRRGAGVEHFGNGGVIHHRERLPFRLKAFHERLVKHARFDQLQGDLPPHWMGLFGQPDLTHAAFTKPADELKARRLSGFQSIGCVDPIVVVSQSIGRWRGSQEAGMNTVVGQQK